MKHLKIEEVLEKEGVFVNTTFGLSMYPMLRDRCDTIIIRPCTGRLKKYDVPLYKRGEKYVLHRIVEVRPDSYIICGDNCEFKEYDITDKQIIGVLTGFYRKNKEINMKGILYQSYARIWVAFYPIRKIWKMSKRTIKSMIKNILKRQSNIIRIKKGDE